MHIPENIREISRKLRKNMTPSEKILWNHIRANQLGVTVLRQKIFYVYTENSGQDRFIIPDFYIASNKLIIEVDGSIHKLSQIMNLDKIKDELIKNRGLQIIRFTNEEIENNINGVINKIKNKIS